MEKRKRTTEETSMDENKVKKAMSKAEASQVFASCSFSSLGLHPNLCDQLRDRMGFEAPTLIQAQAIPVILSGKHVYSPSPLASVVLIVLILSFLQLFLICCVSVSAPPWEI
ncbi:hypothetical protein RHMOL_Rhmol05G0003000 [Rhododendron molle]|uniref:Uncharacterized protein n=1 Tax=Rhododendron molle TaxID=49168 RepID=A0ACC0NIU6_RHOML|nr:hypothetical protein RHMOL_Rhmol05G0003000 [Rhododendron molle]